VSGHSDSQTLVFPSLCANHCPLDFGPASAKAARRVAEILGNSAPRWRDSAPSLSAQMENLANSRFPERRQSIRCAETTSYQ
jgi:hypothetical protein